MTINFVMLFLALGCYKIIYEAPGKTKNQILKQS